MTAQAGLCRTWSETPKTCFLALQLNFKCSRCDISLAGFLLVYQTGIHRQAHESLLDILRLNVFQTPRNAQEQRELESKHNMLRRTLHLARACGMLRQNQTKHFKTNSSGHHYDEIPSKLTQSDSFKLIGCKLPKVGSTNIRRVMYVLDHLSDFTDVNKISEVKSKSWNIIPTEFNHSQMTELKWKLSTYTKFMFVRDPIERLVSAYRDSKPGGFFKAENVSFNEWLVKVSLNSTNRHVKLYSEWCQPCSTKYDFVGQLNNFDDDMNAILEHVGARDLIILPKRERTRYTEAKSSDVIEAFTTNIPRHLLEQIYEKYYMDYFLFGFPRPY